MLLGAVSSQSCPFVDPKNGKSAERPLSLSQSFSVSSWNDPPLKNGRSWEGSLRVDTKNGCEGD